MNTKNILLFSMTSALSLSAFSEDYVSCRREVNNENFQFRQFCEVKEEIKNTKIELERYLDISKEEKIDALEILKNKSIQLNDLSGNSKKHQPLPSLRGYFIASIDFSNDVDCQGSNSVWSHDIKVKAREPDTGATEVINQILYGENKINKDVRQLSFDPIDVYVNPEDENKIVIESEIYIDDETQQSNRPLPYKRIPRSCKMDVNDFAYRFDVSKLSEDLETISNGVDSSIEFMTRARVLNSFFVDKKNNKENGSICTVKSMYDQLNTLEYNFWGVFDFLSPKAQSLVHAAYKEVKNLPEDKSFTSEYNPNSSSSTEVDAYFLEFGTYFEDVFAPYANEKCSGSKIVADVSVDRFDEGSQGYLNAYKYEKAKLDLQQYIAAAWVITNLSKAMDSDYQTAEWISSSSVKINLD